MQDRSWGVAVPVEPELPVHSEVLVEAHVRVAFVVGGRVRPIPKPLRLAMQADRERASDTAGSSR
jgi:acyl-CoA thioester hydrolase